MSGGGASIVKNGAGNLQLGSNSFTGSTTVSGGTLTIIADNSLGTAPGSYSANWLNLNTGSTLAATYTFSLSVNRGITIGAGSTAIDVASGKTLSYGYSGNTTQGITGSGSSTIVKNGLGTLSISSDNHNFTGSVIVNAGRFTFASIPYTHGSGSVAAYMFDAAGFTVNAGGELYLDDTADSFCLNLGGTLTHNGGLLTFVGYPTSVNSSIESVTKTTYASGFTAVTLNAQAGGATIFDYGSNASDIFRTASSGATVLVRGPNLGATANVNVAQYRAQFKRLAYTFEFRFGNLVGHHALYDHGHRRRQWRRLRHVYGAGRRTGRFHRALILTVQHIDHVEREYQAHEQLANCQHIHSNLARFDELGRRRPGHD